MLNLRNYFDIYEILTYPERFGIDAQLQELVESVQVPTIEIYVDDAILKLAQSSLKDFDIDKFTDNVSFPPLFEKKILLTFTNKFHLSFLFVSILNSSMRKSQNET